MKRVEPDHKEIAELLGEMNEEALLANGFEEAILGYVSRFGMGPVALYDYNMCLQILEEEGMTNEEAVEHFDYNVIGSWVGEGTPAFATILKHRRCNKCKAQ